MSDSWLSLNGHEGQNSSSNNLTLPLQIKWTAIDQLFPFQPCSSQPALGIRSNLLVRDGRVYILGSPHGTPLDNLTTRSRMGYMPRATIYTRSIVDGRLMNVAISRHAGGGALLQQSGGSIADSDSNTSEVLAALRNDGVFYLSHGNDSSYLSWVTVSTGDVPGPTQDIVSAGGNSSAGFGISDSNIANWHKASPNSGHGSFAIPEMKHYNAFLCQGQTDLWQYMYNDIAPGTYYPITVSDRATGLQITYSRLNATATQLKPNRTLVCPTFKDSTRSFAGFGSYHCNGAFRPVCGRDGGGLWIFGFKNKNVPPVGFSTPAWSADYSKGMFLFGIKYDGSKIVADVDIPTNIVPGIKDDVYHTYTAQIASLGKYVVAYQPLQSNGEKAQVFCFNTEAKTFAWTATPKTITTVQVGQSYLGKFQASQHVIAGDNIYIVEPRNNGGTLNLSIWSYSLSTGNTVLDGVIFTPLLNGKTIAINSDTYSQPALIELAAVDGLILIQGFCNLTTQFTVAISGSNITQASYQPEAVIRWPAKTTALYSYSNKNLNEFNTGENIDFSSYGSDIPSNESLDFTWDFGDGNTSKEKNPIYKYKSWNNIGEKKNFNVTLLVSANGKIDVKTIPVIITDIGGDTYTEIPVSDVGTPNKSAQLTASMLQYPTVSSQDPTLQVVSKFNIYRNIKNAKLKFKAFWHGSRSIQPVVFEAYSTSNDWIGATVKYSFKPSPITLMGSTDIGSVLDPSQVFIEIPVGDLSSGTNSFIIQGKLPSVSSPDKLDIQIDVSTFSISFQDDGSIPQPPVYVAPLPPITAPVPGEVIPVTITSTAFIGVNAASNVVDGKTATYFDAVDAGNSYIQMNFSASQIAQISYYPRSDMPQRMNGGTFFASIDGNSWNVIHKIPSQPIVGWNYVPILDSNLYTMVRYVTPDGGHCNVAEITLNGVLGVHPQPSPSSSSSSSSTPVGSSSSSSSSALPVGIKLDGITIGTPGSYNRFLTVIPLHFLMLQPLMITGLD